LGSRQGIRAAVSRVRVIELQEYWYQQWRRLLLLLLLLHHCDIVFQAEGRSSNQVVSVVQALLPSRRAIAFKLPCPKKKNCLQSTQVCLWRQSLV